MSQNLKLLADLKTQQEKILSGAKQLELDMEKFDKEIELEVENVSERMSYVIKNLQISKISKPHCFLKVWMKSKNQSFRGKVLEQIKQLWKII